MSFTHYDYVLNRQAAEGILDLTWSEFRKKFGWPGKTEREPPGEFLAFSHDHALWPKEPTSKQLATILKGTSRKTILGAHRSSSSSSASATS